jgi:hypothetical protein
VVPLGVCSQGSVAFPGYPCLATPGGAKVPLAKHPAIFPIMHIARSALALAVVASIGSPSLSQDTRQPSAQAHARTATLVLPSDASGDKGLSIVGPVEVHASEQWPVKVSITVVNLLEEEVFLAVEGLELSRLHYEVNLELPGGGDMEYLGSGGTVAVFPDNTALLRRLHACQYQDDKPRPCGCAMATLQASIGDRDDDLNLHTAIGCQGTMTVPIKGYFRATGKAFSEAAKVPIIIVK